MYNHQSSMDVSEGYFHNENVGFQDVSVSHRNATNKYVFVKQNFIKPSPVEPKSVVMKVLVNPHFNKKVFVNPNFNMNRTGSPSIHVNPHAQKLNLNGNNKDCTSVQKIHINPKVLRNIPLTLNNIGDSNKCPTENKLSCTSVTSGNKIAKRRCSIRSKFKIIKSSFLESSTKKVSPEKRISIKSQYKIIKSSSVSQYSANVVNKFKIDNRKNRIKEAIKISQHKNKKFVYINKFFNISDLARHSLLKRNSKFKKAGLININGILYKKSPNCLRRSSYNKTSKDTSKNVEDRSICKSKFKFIKKTTNKIVTDQRQSKQPRNLKTKKLILRGKLRICNIPCPYYRKYGRCKGNENGKCFRKHDPDQIALCTKFLQGACINKKCLLSHNVSPEKMPTCKFYLEGSCSRDDCPYLHVRINPKADICKDFLEGFCKKASQCDKRHQFLCPDYEKNGKCQKQRCSYPHGETVRKYSVFNKSKFAKKSSDCKKELESNEVNAIDVLIGKEMVSNSENLKSKVPEVGTKSRYYVEQKVGHEDKCKEVVHGVEQNFNDTIDCNQQNGIRSRPKLGQLPSFIAFEEA